MDSVKGYMEFRYLVKSFYIKSSLIPLLGSAENFLLISEKSTFKYYFGKLNCFLFIPPAASVYWSNFLEFKTSLSRALFELCLLVSVFTENFSKLFESEMGFNFSEELLRFYHSQFRSFELIPILPIFSKRQKDLESAGKSRYQMVRLSVAKQTEPGRRKCAQCAARQAEDRDRHPCASGHSGEGQAIRRCGKLAG